MKRVIFQPRPLFHWVFLSVIFFAYAVLRLDNLSQTVVKPRSLRDTQAYVRISQESVFSPEFLTGSRPLGFPLVLKLFNGKFTKVAWAQGLLSLLSWGILAYCVSRSIRLQLFAPFVFGTMLLFSLHHKIIGWDATMLTESLSLSLMALFLAIWFWLKEGWRLYKVFLLGFVAFFWAFTRDTNAWLLLMIAALMLVLVVSKQLKSRYLLPAFIFLVIFLLSYSSAEIGRRWVFPFNNVMADRILVNRKALTYFAECGMPINQPLLDLRDGFAGSEERAFSLDPELEEYRLWLNEKGKSCYMKWLLSNLVGSLSQPLDEANSLLSLEQVDTFFFSRNLSLILPGRVEAMIFPGGWIVEILLVTNVLALFFLLSGASNKNRVWLIVSSLILLVFPHYFLIYHGDVIGIYRHSLSAGVQLYLGLWLTLILLSDTVLDSFLAGTLGQSFSADKKI